MKRIMFFVLAICLLGTSFTIGANAVEETVLSETMLQDVLKETNRELIEDILIPERFDESMQGVELENQPMLLIYNACFYWYAGEPLDEIIEEVHDEKLVYIAILKDEPILLKEYLEGAKIGAGRGWEETPTFVKDIINANVVQTFLGETCCISNVICFDAVSSYKGTTVVYETDKGKFVRFYEDEYAEAVEFTWDDFTQKSIAYYEIVKARNQHAMETGEYLIGKSFSFLQFCENPSQYKVDEMQPKTDYTVLIIAIVGVAVIATAGILVYIRKKKR